VRKAVEMPEVKARLSGMGGEPAATSPKDMHDRVARELATWTKTVDDAGVQKQ
jgi:tripartite-type tricarboxylate transporter receptor subunit TctC